MSDLKFFCPNCGQNMTADERSVGQPIQCPTCQKNFTVPPGTAVPNPPINTAPPSSAVPVQMSGLAVLSFCLALITLPLNALSKIVHFPLGLLSCIPAVICGHMALKRFRIQPNVRGRGFALAGLIIGYIDIALAVIALGFLLVRPHGTLGIRASVSSGQNQPAEPAITTDPNAVDIPSQPVSGTVEKQPFTLKETELNADVLHLRDAPKNSNIEVLIFLFRKPDEGLTGLKRIVPGQNPMPHVHLRWREGDTIRSIALTRGYVLRLELGEQNNHVIPGKIYLELPSSYGTKLAGTFEANVK